MEALDEDGERDLTGEYEGGEVNLNEREVEGVEGGPNDLSAEECFLIKEKEDPTELDFTFGGYRVRE